MYRSLLFVPGDSEKKIAKAQDIAADAIILDLEDSVAPPRRAAARALVCSYLEDSQGKRPFAVFVRINPLTSAGNAAEMEANSTARADLLAVMSGAPDGIVLPKATAPRDVALLAAYLDVLEQAHSLERTPILPVATEVPDAIFALGDYGKVRGTAEGAAVTERLAGLTWGAEDLSTAIGALGNRNSNGAWSTPFEMARSLCLLAAASAGVPAYDTLHADFRDSAGLQAACQRARRDGFVGQLAIHPAQVDIINAAFSPSAEEIAHAQAIVDIFAENPEAGTLSLDGKMLDRPHLLQAQQILARARAAS